MKKQIIKDNKLIAEFIGRCGKDKKYLYTFRGIGKVIKDTIWYTLEDARFHYDWNWLMIVVEKIEELGYFCMINKWTSVYIGAVEKRISITSVEGNTKILNTYKAVIEFINWYNKKA